MREVKSWPEHWMGIAAKTAENRSKDPNTQVGAVIVNDRQRSLTTGYNGFPEGCAETPELWERPVKYGRVIHAELNAIADAARRGVAIEGSTLYVTHFPCLNCAKAVIAAGVKHVVARSVLSNWGDDCKAAAELMNEAGVSWWLWEGPDGTRNIMGRRKTVR